MKAIIKSLLLGSLVSLFTLGSVVSAAQCTNDVWNKVMKRGKAVSYTHLTLPTKA